MDSILVVDDNKTNLQLMKQVLSGSYAVIPVLSGEMALHYLEKQKPDLILLDYLMPEMNGKETMQQIKSNPETANIPIIILTADTAGGIEAECLRLGAADFIAKPFISEVMISRIEKTIELDHFRKDLSQQLYAKSKQVERVTLQSITAIANTIDAKAEFTRGHSIRVAEYATAIAREIGWSNDKIQNLHYVALLHDIGKIGVPDTILNKPAALSQAEYRLIQSHTIIGAQILKDIRMIGDVESGAVSHHERYDGTGYPNHLKGEAIPLVGRIIGIADAYDAMTSERSYRTRLSDEQVHKEIETNTGKQFDPSLARVLLRMIDEGFTTSPLGKENNSEDTSFIEESQLLLQRVIEEREAKMQKEAARDHLTGLYNRRSAEIQVNQYISNQDHRGSFFIMDIDNFKQINDSYGHIAGDYALKRVGKLLAANARDSDIVCRLGGDEFVIFFKGLVARDLLTNKALHILNEFQTLRSQEDSMSATSLSIGIAVSGIDGDDFDSLYVTSDKSLYYVKQNGKNSYHFYSDDKGCGVDETMNSTLVDLRHLMELMKESGQKQGVLTVGYGEFQRIYDFIARCVERTKQEVQVLLFTLSHKRISIITPEELEDSVAVLEQAIFQSLRRSDVSTRYSSSQFIVVLLNSNYDGAQIVTERVRSFYDKMNCHENIMLNKDIAQMKPVVRKE